jgi:hypothetical protein
MTAGRQLLRNNRKKDAEKVFLKALEAAVFQYRIEIFTFYLHIIANVVKFLLCGTRFEEKGSLKLKDTVPG